MAVLLQDLLDSTVARLLPLSDTPQLDAQVLLAHIFDKPRTWLLAHTSWVPDLRAEARLEKLIRRLERGEPLPHVLGHWEFFNLDFHLTPDVLIPRPETELLVDEILRRTAGGHGTAADVGTGSGALALALASEGAFDRVLATDVSGDALEVAQQNAAALAGELRAPVEFRQGQSLAPLAGERLTVLVSNPPYIAFTEARDLPPSVRDWEPATALFAGDDGMAVIGQLAAGAGALLVPGGLLALEVDRRRGDLAVAVVARTGDFATVELVQDLAGRDRFVFAVRRGSP